MANRRTNRKKRKSAHTKDKRWHKEWQKRHDLNMVTLAGGNA